MVSYRCIVTVNVLWLFHPAPWVGLQCVIIVVFTDHTHLLFPAVMENVLQLRDFKIIYIYFQQI